MNKLNFMKFSTWLKLKEESMGGGVAASAPAAGPTSDASSGTVSSDSTSSSSDGNIDSRGTTSSDVARRPFVLGCGYCYPSCKCKSKKKRRRRKKRT